jgi:hypothetical protein
MINTPICPLSDIKPDRLARRPEILDQSAALCADLVGATARRGSMPDRAVLDIEAES